MIEDNKINEFTLSFPHVIDKYLPEITYKKELKLTITDKIGRRLDDIKKTHLFSETAANQFAYRKFMELLPEIMDGKRINFLSLWLKMVTNVEQERTRLKIRSLDSDNIAFLISEELLNVPEYANV
ncbi:3185_t:CDS:1 [Dentiscutata erythropus]|uniref:3185_t:CDS:1 n=1 Tax=Dentiscutata erythropus TaxID=1348616 RepID=A0A9N9JCP9_9GLOM|nr:3185_t:CDS:1 [Dentiscutata erythropus]